MINPIMEEEIDKIMQIKMETNYIQGMGSEHFLYMFMIFLKFGRGKEF